MMKSAETATLCDDSLALYDQYKDILTSNTWGDGIEKVCIMSMFVPGAKSTKDCVTRGWPQWTVDAVILLYDAIGTSDRQTQLEWAYSLAEIVNQPVDYKRAEREFCLKLVNLVLVQKLGYKDFEQYLNRVRSLDDWNAHLYSDYITIRPMTSHVSSDYLDFHPLSDYHIRAALSPANIVLPPFLMQNLIRALWYTNPEESKMFNEFQNEQLTVFRGIFLETLRESIVTEPIASSTEGA